jgi:hypothetical protein
MTIANSTHGIRIGRDARPEAEERVSSSEYPPRVEWWVLVLAVPLWLIAFVGTVLWLRRHRLFDQA